MEINGYMPLRKLEVRNNFRFLLMIRKWIALSKSTTHGIDLFNIVLKYLQIDQSERDNVEVVAVIALVEMNGVVALIGIIKLYVLRAHTGFAK